MKRIIIITIIIFIAFIFPSNISAAITYYTTGLNITQSGVYENLDITNPNGYCVKITAPNVILKNSKIHDCNGYGIWIESTHDVQLINNEVSNTVLNTCYPSCSGGWESALKVRSANQTDKLSYNILVENNRIYENFGEGIGARGSHVTIRNNIFYDNFSFNIYTNGDNTTIEKNLVYCTGNSRFNRDSRRPAGIAQGDEAYTNWNPSHAKDLKVINNIVTGCDRGFSYFGAEPGVENPGLKSSVIAFNTFTCLTRSDSAIRLVYESGQDNVIVHNNIGTTKIDNMTGVRNEGNTVKSFSCGVYNHNNFILNSPLTATGSYTTTKDFLNNNRTVPMDAGAFEYTIGNPTYNDTDLEPDGDVDIFDFNTLVNNFGETGIDGWIRADIVKNGIVDLFDFNKLIENFGK